MGTSIHCLTVAPNPCITRACVCGLTATPASIRHPRTKAYTPSFFKECSSTHPPFIIPNSDARRPGRTQQVAPAALRGWLHDAAYAGAQAAGRWLAQQGALRLVLQAASVAHPWVSMGVPLHAVAAHVHQQPAAAVNTQGCDRLSPCQLCYSSAPNPRMCGVVYSCILFPVTR